MLAVAPMSRTRMMSSLVIILLTVWTKCCQGWITSPSFASQSSIGRRKNLGERLYESTSTASKSTKADQNVEDDEDDDDEYEYVEYDILLEEEFRGSEWLIGTVMGETNLNNIKETWVRLAVDKDGKNVAIWGDDAQGSWNFDVASQFLSMSKEKPWGKNIWAGVVDDYYYIQGTVRGWSVLTPASVIGQWQAKRLGVDADEAGIAPWMPGSQQEEFEDEESEEEADDDEEKEETEETDESESAEMNQENSTSVTASAKPVGPIPPQEASDDKKDAKS